MAEERPTRRVRGFAAMDPEKQREIARKGGEAVSRNRQHMAEIGRKGGEASHGKRQAEKASTGDDQKQRQEEEQEELDTRATGTYGPNNNR